MSTAQSDNVSAPAPSDNVSAPTSDNVSDLPPSGNTSPPPDIVLSLSGTSQFVGVDGQAAGSYSSIVSVTPDQSAEIKSASGNVTLRIPAGAVSAPTNVEIKEHVPPVSTGMKIVRQFELNAWLSFSTSNTTGDNTTTAVTQFNKSLQLSVSNSSDDVRGIDVDSLRLYYLDAQTKQWFPVMSQYDRTTGNLTASITHFSNYGEIGNSLTSGPGRVMAAQVSLQSGAAIYNYPIELPPAPGGFQPKLGLAYNSGSVDEMKNKQAVGSWVGVGWSLGFGDISLDLSTNDYYLDLSGGSYKLFSSDGVNYRTQPDRFYKITRNGDMWEMWDISGNYYRFGGNSDSRQYVNGTSTYYRWDLDTMTDTNGNEMMVSYTQDIRLNWVRSAYPQYLRYDNNLVQVQFFSSFDITNDPVDGNLRTDDPKSFYTDQYMVNPAPEIMENKKLDAIEIRVGTDLHLVRKYVFNYSTSPSQVSTDYDYIYYSGQHTLLSVSQVGADGTSSLPAATFSYQDLQVFRQSTTDQYTDWQTLVKDAGNHYKRYYYDDFQRLVKVEELQDDQSLYATTTYAYDVPGNLLQVKDNNGNTTTMTYDWLSRKTAMSDPDMGNWSYAYDNNGNLQTQTDAKGQVITFGYDALDRLTGKTYQQGSGMTNVTYTYDAYDGVAQFGRGQRTGMTDASGTMTYKYDQRGRQTEEKRTINGTDYITDYAYDDADRIATITYPDNDSGRETGQPDLQRPRAAEHGIRQCGREPGNGHVLQQPWLHNANQSGQWSDHLLRLLGLQRHV